MKTAVTVINTVQTGMDNYKDLKETKVFDDSATLGEIKEWVISRYYLYNRQYKAIKENIGLAGLDISDVE